MTSTYASSGFRQNQQQMPNDINMQNQQMPNDIFINNSINSRQPMNNNFFQSQISQDQYQQLMQSMNQQQQNQQYMLNMLNQINNNQQTYIQSQIRNSQLQNQSGVNQMQPNPQQQMLREKQKQQAFEMGKLLKMQKEAIENSIKRENERKEQKKKDDFTLFIYRNGKVTPLDFNGENIVGEIIAKYKKEENFNDDNAKFKFKKITLSDKEYESKYLWEIEEMTNGEFTNGSQIDVESS